MSDPQSPVNILSCPHCQTPNDPASRFCIECGRPLAVTVPCPQCGAGNAPDARFCTRCGHSFTDQAPKKLPVRWLAVGGGVILLLIAIGGLLLWKLGTGQAPVTPFATRVAATTPAARSGASATQTGTVTQSTLPASAATPTVESTPTATFTPSTTPTPTPTATPKPSLKKAWSLETGDIQWLGVAADGYLYGVMRRNWDEYFHVTISPEGEVVNLVPIQDTARLPSELLGDGQIAADGTIFCFSRDLDWKSDYLQIYYLATDGSLGKLSLADVKADWDYNVFYRSDGITVVYVHDRNSEQISLLYYDHKGNLLDRLPLPLSSVTGDVRLIYRTESGIVFIYVRESGQVWVYDRAHQLVYQGVPDGLDQLSQFGATADNYLSLWGDVWLAYPHHDQLGNLVEQRIAHIDPAGNLDIEVLSPDLWAGSAVTYRHMVEIEGSYATHQFAYTPVYGLPYITDYADGRWQLIFLGPDDERVAAVDLPDGAQQGAIEQDGNYYVWQGGVLSKYILHLPMIQATIPLATPRAGVAQTPTPPLTPQPVILFLDDFDGSTLDPQRWTLDRGNGSATLRDGLLRLSSAGRRYPYLYTPANPFPTGDFRMAVRFRYAKVQTCGVGVMLASELVPVGLAESETAARQQRAESQGVQAGIWQDRGNGLQVWFRSGSDRADIPIASLDTKWHELTIEYTQGRYTLYLDDSLVYTSLETDYRPQHIWIGHPAKLQNKCQWSSLMIDYIRVENLAPAMASARVDAEPSPTATPGPQHRLVFVSERTGSPQIWVMEADGSGQKQLTREGRNTQPAWSPDNQQIAFVSTRDGSRQVYLMDADGSGQQRLTDQGENISPQWASTGKLAYLSNRDGNWELYVDGQRITRNDSDDLYYTWSPQGTKIAFEALKSKGNYRVLYVINPDGSGLQRISGENYKSWNVSWSGDGQRLVFASDKKGNARIFTCQQDGSGWRVLTQADKWSQLPAWSPVAQTICFVRQDGQVWTLYSMNDRGQSLRKLASYVHEGETAVWSSDGRQIAFSGRKDGDLEIYVINSQGKDLEQLTRNKSDDYSPAWTW